MLRAHEIRRVWNLFFALHPNPEVVSTMMADFFEGLKEVKKQEGIRWNKLKKKRNSDGRRVLPLPVGCDPQVAAYRVSQRWEYDQESRKPVFSPKYQPTREDRLVRYLKYLIAETMQKRSPYIAVALGCSLYTYGPHEIYALMAWDEDDTDDLHDWVLTKIRGRFPNVLIEEKRVVRDNDLNPDEARVVCNALQLFAPWTSHFPDRPFADRWQQYFGKTHATTEPPEVEWARIHMIVDPACAGLASLVEYYNSQMPPGASKLAAPDTRLRVPKLGGDDEDRSPPPDRFHPTPPPDGVWNWLQALESAYGRRWKNTRPREQSRPLRNMPSSEERLMEPGDRFQPPPLRMAEYARIKQILKRNRARRRAFRAGRLSIYVDGREQAWLEEQAWLDPHTHFRNTFTVPSDTASIEVFGHDTDGPLLLAVFSVVAMPLGEEGAEQHQIRRHASGLTIEIVLRPVQVETREVMAYSAELTCREAQRQRIRTWLRHRGITLQTFDIKAFRQLDIPAFARNMIGGQRRLVPYLLTLGLLVSLGLNGWLGSHFLEQRRQAVMAAAQSGHLFHTYRFQASIRSTTPLGVLATAHAVVGEPPRVLGFSAPEDARATFFRLGTWSAEVLIYVHSDDQQRAAQRLEMIMQALATIPASKTSPPKALSQYVSEIQLLLQNQRYSREVLEQFLGLFETLYAEAYTNTADALIFFRAGAGLENLTLAAAAGDRAALHQGDALQYLQSALSRLDAPKEVLQALEQVRRLITHQEISDTELAEILRLVKTIQEILGS